jgi:transposase
MKVHANAALTISQRQEVVRLHREEGVSVRKLAARFHVNPTTIQRWLHREAPLDLSSAPLKTRSGLTPEQKEAIRRYRAEHPSAGGRTIAMVVGKSHGRMSHATISRFLRSEGQTLPREKRAKEREPLKVGRHRLQMDIQKLPAIRGGRAFEYKITIIHMATRMKYSEIYPTISSELVAQAVEHALGQLPPFFFNLDG